jgi:hypothetical protein
MSWSHVVDALIFVAGMTCAFALAIWVENRSQHYSRDFERRFRNWDHRAVYDFDRHCDSAGVKDRRSLLPGRWAA